MPTYRVRAPDGRVLRIRADDEAAAQRGARQWVQQNPKSNDPLRGTAYQSNRTRVSNDVAAGGTRQAGREASGAVSNFFSGIPFYQDAAAALATPFDRRLYDRNSGVSLGEAYRDTRETLRADTEGFRERRPVAGALATGTGNAATMLVPGGAAAGAMTRAPQGASVGARLLNTGANAVRGGTAAAASGALFGGGMDGTAAERLGNAGSGALVSAALGAPLGALAGRTPKPKVSRPAPAPTREELGQAANAAYQRVDDIGATYTPEAAQTLVQGIADDLAAQTVDPVLHPKVTRVVELMRERLGGQSPTLTQLDQWRQIIRRNVIANGTDDERRLGQQMIQNIDEFVAATGPEQLVGGRGAEAAGVIREARDLYQRTSKIERVDEAVEAARLQAGSTGSGGNVNNAIRQKLRGVLQRERGLTPDERAALNEIVVGTAGQNLLRQVGKLSPEGNGLMQALHIGAGIGTAGATVPLAIGGALAKSAADRGTQKRVAQLVDLMARGGQRAGQAEEELATMAANDPAVAELYNLIAERLSRGVGAASAMSAQ